MNHIFTQIVKLAALNMYIPDPMTTSLQKVKVVEGGKLSAKPVLNCPLPCWGAEPKLQAVLQLKQGGAHQVTQTQTKIPPTRPVRSQKAKLHLTKEGIITKCEDDASQLNVVQTGDQLLQVVVVTS